MTKELDSSTGVLYQAGRYVVVAINDYLKDNRVIDAYAVINIQTGVSEYETRMLWDAFNWCKRCELLVAKVLDGEEDEDGIDWEGTQEDE